MLLAIDIGNTNVHIGVFSQETLACSCRLSTDSRRLEDEYGHTMTSVLDLKGITPECITSAVICSVVPPLSSRFEDVCKSYFGVSPLIVSTGIRTGVRIRYDNPRDVGSDRIVDAVAAYRLYGGPTIVVDFGTATVFDAISKEGDYIGGAISPGIEVAAEALHQSAAQLRRTGLQAPQSAIGLSTATSLQSGLFLGYVSLVEGMVERFKQELGQESTVIATGGIATTIAKETNIFDIVNLDLTLIGLRMIFEMNQTS